MWGQGRNMSPFEGSDPAGPWAKEGVAKVGVILIKACRGARQCFLEAVDKAGFVGAQPCAPTQETWVSRLQWLGFRSVS